MAEAIDVLQAVAESAIEPDMSEPDERDRVGQRAIGRDARDEEGSGEEVRVHEVVRDSADSRVGHVSEHPDTGCQQENGEKTPDYAGSSRRPAGQPRTHPGRSAGTGHSEPNLACPEVGRLGSGWSEPASPIPKVRADLQSAAEACHDRLTGEGIDLSAYNLTESAAHVEDVRRALGIPRWNIASYGSPSRIALEVVRRSPDRIRAMWLDTPQFPQVDEVTLGISGTRYALSQISADCAADRACSRRFPDLSNALREAVVRLDERPVTVTVADTPAAEAAGHPIRVVVDGGAFLRAVRDLVSNIDLGMAPGVPALVYRALEGDVEVVAHLYRRSRSASGTSRCAASSTLRGSVVLHPVS